MRIGAHVSTSGALGQSIQRAAQIGAECAQIFVGAPQRWKHLAYSDENVAEFRRLAAESGIGPNVVHALYLVNLASPDPMLRARSIESLVDQMQWCDALGGLGLIAHVGSRVGTVSHDEAMERVATGIGEVLSRTHSACFLIENTAGMGTSIGSSFAEIGEIIRRLGGDERLGVCLDTAHTFESGHDYSTPSALDAVLDEFDREVGLERLAAIHANDSKTPLGSNVDRHENIGQGHVGEAAFELFMRHPAMRDLPFYLEVPGLAGKGPDRENIEALRRLAGLVPLPIAQE
jgi:deoxyribonuclease IV